jgi:hypothetical protein
VNTQVSGVPVSTRFGVQPAHKIIRDQQWTFPAVAKALDIPFPHLVRSVRGMTVPSPGLRERLPELLGVPLEELFTAEILAHTYDTHRGPNAAARRKSDWAV